jgi:hypothetical protein
MPEDFGETDLVVVPEILKKWCEPPYPTLSRWGEGRAKKRAVRICDLFPDTRVAGKQRIVS